MSTATYERPATTMPPPPNPDPATGPQGGTVSALRVSEQPLAALPTAVGCARRFARHTLAAWRLDRLGALADTVDVVVSELVTHAVRVTGITIDHPRYADLLGRRLNLLIVRLRHLGASLVIEVWDVDPTPPGQTETVLDTATGQARFPDASLATRWHYYCPASGGKIIWIQLELPPPDAFEDAQQLPRLRRPHTTAFRAPYPAGEPVEVSDDRGALRRIAEGLHRLDRGDSPQNGDRP